MIEYGQRDWFAVDRSGQDHPAAASAPYCFSLNPFAAEILTGDSGVVQLRDTGRFAAGIGKHFGFV